VFIATAMQVVGLGHDNASGLPGAPPMLLCQPGASCQEDPPSVVRNASPDLVPSSNPVRMQCSPVVQWMVLMVMAVRTWPKRKYPVGTATWVQLAPPLVLDTIAWPKAPVAASTPNPSPPARQKPLAVQEMVESPEAAGGSLAAVHVLPPSVLKRAATPAGGDGPDGGHWPTAAHTSADSHETESSGTVDSGTGTLTHVEPAFSETSAVAESALPPAPRPTEMQYDAVTQVTSTRSVTPAGSWPGTHVAPESPEVSTCPSPPMADMSLELPAVALE
jgi:hypothetical protein